MLLILTTLKNASLRIHVVFTSFKFVKAGDVGRKENIRIDLLPLHKVEKLKQGVFQVLPSKLKQLIDVAMSISCLVIFQTL